MNKDILLKILNEHEIPPWMYSLDGVSDPNGDQICIIKNDKNWDVFQNNRGQLDLLKTFDVENDAYEYIYNFQENIWLVIYHITKEIFI